jgi:hypothetical protein
MQADAEAANSPEALDDLDELVGYHSVGYVLSLADSILAKLDHRTLDLGRQRGQLKALSNGVEQARRSAGILHGGLTRPTGGKPTLGLPTPAQAGVWQELHQLEDIRQQAARRDRAASGRHPDCERDRWTVHVYQPDGYFSARRADGITVGGWTETPEGVPDTLRNWSIPCGYPVAVTWAREPPRPGRRHPWGGWPESVRPNELDEWHAKPPDGWAAFSAALAVLRESWPGGDLLARLAESADQLNAEEPQAPPLSALHRESDTVILGRTQVAEWIDPAAIAHTGTPRWNDFGSHRPGQVALIASAMLSDRDPADIATNVWADPSQAVTLTRVPGPAGPLYEIAYNGMHRSHTARLLRFPLLWAIVDEQTLPTQVHWYSLVEYAEVPSDQVRDEILTCWRGALRRGLIDGELDETNGTLHIIWALSPWLLDRPGSAAAWARNYERVYPGTLAEFGIPALAWQTTEEWQDWLGGHDG